MRIHVGDMFTAAKPHDWIFFTANSTLAEDGRLVMGAGAAKAAAYHYQYIGRDLGDRIAEVCGSLGEYNLVLSRANQKLGAFQVKFNWRNDADLDLIWRSAQRLKLLATAFPNDIFHLNYPGIGYGGRTKEEVWPSIEQLPPNVLLWKKETDDVPSARR